MSAAVATMMNLCCAASGTQMLQSAYGFSSTFLRHRSQRHANVNSSRQAAVGRSVPARQLITHSSISTTGVSLRSCFLTASYHYYIGCSGSSGLTAIFVCQHCDILSFC